MKGPPSPLLLSHFHILPCGWPMNPKQHGRIWKWIQGNLEMYRILEGGIDTSPVEKILTRAYPSMPCLGKSIFLRLSITTLFECNFFLWKKTVYVPHLFSYFQWQYTNEIKQLTKYKQQKVRVSIVAWTYYKPLEFDWYQDG